MSNVSILTDVSRELINRSNGGKGIFPTDTKSLLLFLPWMYSYVPMRGKYEYGRVFFASFCDTSNPFLSFPITVYVFPLVLRF